MSVLADKLDALVEQYDRRYLDTDPLQFVHRFDDARDQEIIGLLAAALAYGKVSIVHRSVQAVLDIVGSQPRAFVEQFDASHDAKRFDGFKHRFNDGTDIALFFHLIAQQIRRYGSLGALFMSGYDDAHETIAPALTHFVAEIWGGDARPILDTRGVPTGHSALYLLSSPAAGSACKRMLLFLRWMIRDDGLDVGAWPGVPASKLLVPLDTHVFRIGRYLGLVERKSHDLRASEEMTASLRRLDPEDPVRYDFALARLGILAHCPKKRDPVKCAGCDLLDVCQLR